MESKTERKLEMTLNEINQFFETFDKVESRIAEVAHLCTNICSCEEIKGFRNSGDEVCISTWSQDFGDNTYYIPLKYLAMEDDEIAECEKKKAEERRRLAEKQEHQEYERLKKKYERGAK